MPICPALSWSILAWHFCSSEACGNHLSDSLVLRGVEVYFTTALVKWVEGEPQHIPLAAKGRGWPSTPLFLEGSSLLVKGVSVIVVTSFYFPKEATKEVVMASFLLVLRSRGLCHYYPCEGAKGRATSPRPYWKNRRGWQSTLLFLEKGGSS